MNKNQKIILTVAAAATLMMLLFPPFYVLVGNPLRKASLGYSFILSTPPQWGKLMATIDATTLMIQWTGVTLIAALLYFAVRSEK